jgi:hypothetical protein
MGLQAPRLSLRHGYSAATECECLINYLHYRAFRVMSLLVRCGAGSRMPSIGVLSGGFICMLERTCSNQDCGRTEWEGTTD